MKPMLCCLFACAGFLCAGDGRAEVERPRGGVTDALAKGMREVEVSGRFLIFEAAVLSEWSIPKQPVDREVKAAVKEVIARLRAGRPETSYPKGVKVKVMGMEVFEFLMESGERVQCFPDSVLIEDEVGTREYRDVALFPKVRGWIKQGRIKAKKTREMPEAKIVVPEKE